MQDELLNGGNCRVLFVNLFEHQPIVARPVLSVQTSLTEALNLHEYLQVLELFVLFVQVVLALDERKVQCLSLIAFVSVECSEVCAYLFDLHAVWKFHLFYVDLILFYDPLDLCLLMPIHIDWHLCLLHELLNAYVL